VGPAALPRKEGVGYDASMNQCSPGKDRGAPAHRESTMNGNRRVVTYPKAGSQLAFARMATAFALFSIGALSIGAIAIGALAIKRFALDAGRIKRLSIEELDVGRLRVRETISDSEARRSSRP
jgi:hypothetical protein